MVFKCFILLAILSSIASLPNVLDGSDHSHHHDHSHDHSHDHTQDNSHTPVSNAGVKNATARASEINDGGRLLALPEAQACADRPKQWQRDGHWYFLSTLVPQYKDVKLDWLDARNLCRKHCMDSISIETAAEYEMVTELIRRENLPYIWTSGRLCNFKGCDRADLQPLSVNGWFWSGSGVKLAPTDRKPLGWGFHPWSHTGHFKRPQPDNAEFDINQTTEACLGVLNNVYKDGIQWHDIGCYHTKAVICEDSAQLLKYISATNPGINL